MYIYYQHVKTKVVGHNQVNIPGISKKYTNLIKHNLKLIMSINNI